MIQEGMATQAAAVGQSLVSTIWSTDQLWFRTPEAWYQSAASGFRAPYYMRAPTDLGRQTSLRRRTVTALKK